MSSDDNAPPTTVYVRDVLAVVGDVMLRWGLLETTMLSALDEKRASPGIFQRWLSAYDVGPEIKREIVQLARVRHLLAHGLCGVEGLVGLSGVPRVRCRRANGTVIEISLTELETSAQHLDLLRLRVDRHDRGLGHFSQSRPGV